jgi:HTH-type transcriptional regulator/antitoxin HigA
MGRSRLARSVDRQEYADLISNNLPHVIQSEAENEEYLRLLEALDGKARPTAAEKELANLLTLLVEEFEGRHYALKRASPLENLRELMRANNLKQKDLVDVFGTPSIVSEVLSGKRGLTTEHVRRLSERFRVTPELFI